METPTPPTTDSNNYGSIVRLPLADIDPGSRLRSDYGDLPGMMASLKRYGQMSAIAINSERRLIFGGRRYYSLCALLDLGTTHLGVDDLGNPIPWDGCANFVYGTGLNNFELRLREIEENVQRKDMTWQEKALGALEISRLKGQEAARKGESWTNVHTGLMIGLSRQRVEQVLPIAHELSRSADSPLWSASSFEEAARMLLNILDERAKVALARSMTTGISQSNLTAAISVTTTSKPQLSMAKLGLLTGLGTHGDVAKPESADAPPVHTMKPEEIKLELDRLKATPINIELANQMMLGSCLDHMRQLPVGAFHHIVTDPPYAIDMKMLQQQNTGMNVEQTVNEHEVQENIELLKAFVPLAFQKLPEKGFLVMCCDSMNFAWLVQLGLEAGFAVQRWPVVWCKPLAMNQAAGFNFTKATEDVVIMRKSGSVLAQHQPLNWRAISKTQEDKGFDHPFAKPCELWQWLATAVSKPDEILYDPFAGSHSAACAFLKCGRNFISSERGEQHLYTGVTNVTRTLKEFYAKAGLTPTITYNAQ